MISNSLRVPHWALKFDGNWNWNCAWTSWISGMPNSPYSVSFLFVFFFWLSLSEQPLLCSYSINREMDICCIPSLKGNFFVLGMASRLRRKCNFVELENPWKNKRIKMKGWMKIEWKLKECLWCWLDRLLALLWALSSPRGFIGSDHELFQFQVEAHLFFGDENNENRLQCNDKLNCESLKGAIVCTSSSIPFIFYHGRI